MVEFGKRIGGCCCSLQKLSKRKWYCPAHGEVTAKSRKNQDTLFLKEISDSMFGLIQVCPELQKNPITAASNNALIYRLGLAVAEVNAQFKNSDEIDRGLILLRILNEKGFDIVMRSK